MIRTRNREREKAQRNAAYKANPEKYRLKSKLWRLARLEAVKKKQLESYFRHHAARKAKSNEWKKNNRARINAYMKEYY